MPRIALSEEEKRDLDKLENWLMNYACGYRNARTKDKIIPFIQLEERYFRHLCSMSDVIFSSSNRGYWILPLVDLSGDEARVAKEALEEERRRAINLFWKVKAKKRVIMDRFGCSYQQVLF